MLQRLQKFAYPLALGAIFFGVVVVYGSYTAAVNDVFHRVKATHGVANHQAESEYQQAINFVTGNGVTQDRNRAIALLKASAEHGYREAQFMLGDIYYRGELLQDYSMAYFWFALAADNGHAKAPALRYEVSAHLSPAELIAVKQKIENQRKR